MNTRCIFCRIIAGEDAYRVYENDTTLAFLDVSPSTDGHTMVIHKVHGATILDYSPLHLQELWTTVQKVIVALELAYDTKSISIGVNHGELGGVPHLHIHLIPRVQNDGGKVIQSLVQSREQEELITVQKKIKTRIDKPKNQ